MPDMETINVPDELEGLFDMAACYGDLCFSVCATAADLVGACGRALVDTRLLVCENASVWRLIKIVRLHRYLPMKQVCIVVSYKERLRSTSDGETRFECTWEVEDPRGIVVLVHGWADHSGRYAHVADYLNDHGYSVTSFDQRGMGRSSGPPGEIGSFAQSLDDLASFVSEVDRPDGLPMIILGHSFGGVLSSLYCARRDGPASPQPAGLILSSPAFKLVPNPVLQPFAGLVARLMPRFEVPGVERDATSRDPKVVREAKTDPLIYNGRATAHTGAQLLYAGRKALRVAPDIRTPLLAFHGTADRIASYKGTEAFVQRYGGTSKSFTPLEGLYHETLNEPERSVPLNLISGFLDALR